MSTGARPLEVEAVENRRQQREFLKLPHRLYAADPDWVAPLNRDIRAFFSPRHPFRASCGDLAFFLARRDDRVVGRIAAIHNRRHNEYHQDRVGFFGFFESEDDPKIAARLLDVAATWLRERGLDTLRGPLSPSTNYEAGLWVGGDPGPPVLMMPYNPPWYADHLEAWGLAKTMDLFAFHLEEGMTDLDRWARIGDKVLRRHGARFRRLDKKRFDEEIRLIGEIYHDAWSRNWGFVPLSESELRHMARELKTAVLPWLSGFVVNRDGRDVAFYVGIPDYNRVLIKLKGRLFPFGFIRLLRAGPRLPAMRLMLLGVRKEYQTYGFDGVMYNWLSRNCIARGVTQSEASWVLETNLPLIHAMERAGARHYRTYRIYDKPL